MAIKPYQPGFIPVGHFDVLDTDQITIKGGEVVVFDELSPSAMDHAAPDVYVDNGLRSVLRLATPLDVGPFMFANIEDNAAFVAPGFELSSLFGKNQSFGQTMDASSKLSVFTQDGFYAISSNVVDTTTVNTTTSIHTRLYVNSEGMLTATPSPGGALVGYFIDYRLGSILRASNFQHPETFSTDDSVIVYKNDSDGYLNLNFLQTLIGQQGEVGNPSDGTYSDGYIPFSPNTTLADAIAGLNEIVFDLALNQIGIPTDGTYADGYLPFTYNTTVADAVAGLNESVYQINLQYLGYPADGGYSDGYLPLAFDTPLPEAMASVNEVLGVLAAKQIGIPTDLTYADGYLPFTYNTTVADAVDGLNEEVLELATAIAPPGDDGYVFVDRGGWTEFTQVPLRTYRGPISFNIESINTDYQLSVNDSTLLVDATNGPVVITVPAPETINRGQIYTVKKIDSTINLVTIMVLGGGLIDGAPAVSIGTQFNSVTVQSNGVQWWEIL